MQTGKSSEAWPECPPRNPTPGKVNCPCPGLPWFRTHPPTEHLSSSCWRVSLCLLRSKCVRSLLSDLPRRQQGLGVWATLALNPRSQLSVLTLPCCFRRFLGLTGSELPASPRCLDPAGASSGIRMGTIIQPVSHGQKYLEVTRPVDLENPFKSRARSSLLMGRETKRTIADFCGRNPRRLLPWQPRSRSTTEAC